MRTEERSGRPRMPLPAAGLQPPASGSAPARTSRLMASAGRLGFRHDSALHAPRRSDRRTLSAFWRLDPDGGSLPILWQATQPRRRKWRRAGSWGSQLALHHRTGWNVRVGCGFTAPLRLHRSRVRGRDQPGPACPLFGVCLVSAPVRAADRFVGGVTIELDCRKCGQPFTPTPEALRKGPPHWWYCDQCRPAEARDSEVPE
jgi:hypothetical protein